MKKILLLSLFTLTIHLFLLAQYPGSIIGVNESGYGSNNGPAECITNKQRQAIEAEKSTNKKLLEAKGILQQSGTDVSRSPHTLFAWPLQPAPGFNDYGYYGFGAYVDHDTLHPNTPKDYYCGTQSYYNSVVHFYHPGTDIELFPFGWTKEDSNSVQVIAAATGVITYKTDTNPDHSCVFNPGDANIIILQHADGSESWYGHMKKGSLNSKGIGDTLQTGEFIGIVGSSGNATGPHVHFEVHKAGGGLIDPFMGNCNTYNSDSWWISQKDYIERGINHVATNRHAPATSPCPNEEIPNEADYFSLGDTVYCTAYIRGLRHLDTVHINYWRPDNTIYTYISYTNTDNQLYSAVTLTGLSIIPKGEAQGKWKLEVIYNQQSYIHYFYEDGPAGIGAINSSGNEFLIYPNPFHNTVHIVNTDPDQPFTVSLINSLGQVLYKTKVNPGLRSTDINIENLPAGIYQALFNAPCGIKSKTLIKQ